MYNHKKAKNEKDGCKMHIYIYKRETHLTILQSYNTHKTQKQTKPNKNKQNKPEKHNRKDQK